MKVVFFLADELPAECHAGTDAPESTNKNRAPRGDHFSGLLKGYLLRHGGIIA